MMVTMMIIILLMMMTMIMEYFVVAAVDVDNSDCFTTITTTTTTKTTIITHTHHTHTHTGLDSTHRGAAVVAPDVVAAVRLLARVAPHVDRDILGLCEGWCGVGCVILSRHENNTSHEPYSQTFKRTTYPSRVVFTSGPNASMEQTVSPISPPIPVSSNSTSIDLP